MQGPVQYPARGQDHAPGVDLDQVARPQRHQHRDDQNGLARAARHLGHVEGDREGQEHVGDRDGGRDGDRAQGNRPVHRLVDERLEVVQREGLGHLAGERVDVPERRCEQDRQRPQVADHQPAKRARQQAADGQPGTAGEQPGHPPADGRARPGGRLSGFHRRGRSAGALECLSLDLRPGADPVVVVHTGVSARVPAVRDRRPPDS